MSTTSDWRGCIGRGVGKTLLMKILLGMIHDDTSCGFEPRDLIKQ